MAHLPSLAALDARAVAPTGMTIQKMQQKQAKQLFDAWTHATVLVNEAKRKYEKRLGEYNVAMQRGGSNAADAREAAKKAELLVLRTCMRSDGLLKLLNRALEDLGEDMILQKNGEEADDCVVEERAKQKQAAADRADAEAAARRTRPTVPVYQGQIVPPPVYQGQIVPQPMAPAPAYYAPMGYVVKQ